MNTLPIEIVDNIFNLYWMDRFKSVVGEINGLNYLEKKIKLFIDKYAINMNFFDLFNDVYLHHLTILNKEIVDYVKRIPRIYCRVNNLKLYYCYDLNKSIFSRVHVSLHHICAFCITYCGILRYRILHRFEKISTSDYCKNYNDITER